MHSIPCFTTLSSSDELVYGVDAADRMVKIELEAAEALAGLAQVATGESGEAGSTKWGSKGKRARGRVKSESPLLHSPDLVRLSRNCQATMGYDQVEEIDICSGSKRAKIKQLAKLLTPSLVFDASTIPFGGSRSKKKLTEAEKEEKRLRRVLANRESARQTIRRRQALHEELSRKTSDLSMENVDLKQERELALEKLRSLKTANELLKAQWCQSVSPVREENFLQVVRNLKPIVEENLLQTGLTIKAEVEENLELKLAYPGVSSSKNTSVLYCNNKQLKNSQWTPLLLPSIVQSLSSDQSAHMPCVATLATLPMFASGLNSSEQKSCTTGSPLAPVYILPCPWFLPEGQNESPPVENSKYNTVAVSSPCNSTFSSDTGTLIQNRHSTSSLKAKVEVCGSKENIPGTPFLHMIDGTGAGVVGGLAAGSVRNLSPDMSNPLRVQSNAKPKQWLSQDTSQLENRSHCSLPHMNKETTFSFPIKITEHAVAAAEARKRRKELTRFKNFHGSQFRLPC